MRIAAAKDFHGNSRFEVRSQLGSGGMGVVYEAYDHQQQTTVALKTIRSRNPDALLQLKNEFRELQDLEHPNLVSLGELIEADGQWFFTMELVDGENLIRYICTESEAAPPLGPDEESRSLGHTDEQTRPCGPPVLTLVSDDDDPLQARPWPEEDPAPESWSYDEQRLREVLVQLVEALMALHAAGRVHRDIKPSNILVTPEGRVVLLDFGLVTRFGSFTSEESGALTSVEHCPKGTAAYMAPEQAASSEVGPEADWYSLGVLLFEAISGRLPFSGTPMEIIAAKHAMDPPRLRDIVEDVPADLDALCWHLLRYDPVQRPAGADVLRHLQPRRMRVGRPARGLSRHTETPVFVGREQELAELLEAFAAAREGETTSVLVHGASGFGKSELLRAFARTVRRKDPEAVVLESRCYERESVPFKAFDGVVDALSRLLRRMSKEEVIQLAPRNVDLLTRVFPVLGRVQSLGRIPRSRRRVEDLQEVRSRAFKALQELLARLADWYPVVVIIDDLQWADEDSLMLLRSLLQSDAAPAICLVASLRTSSTAGAVTTADSASTDETEAAMTVERASTAFPPELRRLRVGPLPREQAHLLVTKLLGRDDLGMLTERICRESSGHPLFIRELVQHTLTEGPSGSELRLDDVLRARVHALEPALRTLVELVAVAGAPLRQGVLAQAVQLPTATLTRQVARLRVISLLRTSGSRMEDIVEPYHDRVRVAVLKGLGPTAKQRWHEKLAHALEATSGTEPELLALHFERAGDQAKAALYAAEAAAEASRTLAFDRAARLYRKALSLWPFLSPDGQEERFELWVSLGDALANAGRGGGSASAYIKATHLAKKAQRVELVRKASEQLFRSGHISSGMIAMEQVLRALGVRLPRTPRGALLSLLRGRLRLRLRGTGFRLRDESKLSAEQLLRVDIAHSVAIGLALADNIRGADFSTRFIRAALDAGEPSRVLMALALECNYLASTGGSAFRSFRQMVALSERLLDRMGDDPVVRGYIETSKAFGAFMDGKWAQCREHAERAVSVIESGGGAVSNERGIMRFLTLWALFYQGELNEMSKRVVALERDAMDRGDRFLQAGVVLGRSNLAHVNMLGPDRAREKIEQVMQSLRVDGYHLQHYHAMQAQVHIDIYKGDGCSAYARVCKDWPALKRSQLLRLPSVRNEARHLRALAALAAADSAPPREKKALLAVARRDARYLARRKMGWTKARAHLLQAGIAFQQGERDRAIEQLRSAIDGLDREQMDLMAAAARRRLAELLGEEAGAELRAESDAFMERHQVSEPARMTALFAPGF